MPASDAWAARRARHAARRWFYQLGQGCGRALLAWLALAALFAACILLGVLR